jgi:hypothetical protein
MENDRIYESLLRIQDQMGRQSEALARLEEKVGDIPDHEVRLRVLERWKYGLPVTGATAVASALLSAWTFSKGA